MTKQEVLEQLDGYDAAPNSSEFCDALCDAAEFLGLPEGEYDAEELREKVEAADDEDNATVFVVRANLSANHDGMPRQGIFGDEPTVYADESAAEDRAEVLRTTGDWQVERPEYYVEEVGVSDLKPAERREWEAK